MFLLAKSGIQWWKAMPIFILALLLLVFFLFLTQNAISFMEQLLGMVIMGI